MTKNTAANELKIEILEALKDNYIYVLFHTETKEALVVDPSEAPQVIQFLKDQNLNLSAIINTHHHYDHIGGNGELKALFPKAKVYAPQSNSAQIPTGDEWITGQEKELRFLGHQTQAIPVPGHTLGHLAFYFSEAKVLFTGDTLFAFGCGRLFEGDPAMMWKSFLKLRALPDDVQVYCGHEYTQNNLEFCLSLEPENFALRDELQRAKDKRAHDKPTIPFLLGQQKELNPFFRADDPFLRNRLNMNEASEADVFGFVRGQKDSF